MEPAAGEQKQILFVAHKRDARPVLGQLRHAGHRVSLVADLEHAHALLQSGGFQQAVLPAPTLLDLLDVHVNWDRTEVDGWRRSVSALAHDLESLLTALSAVTGGERALDPAAAEEAAPTIAALSAYLHELTSELSSAVLEELRLSVLDLEGIIEKAAITVYPVAAERRQRLVIDVEETAAAVRADSAKLTRILAGILAYAAARSPRQGRVRVHACEERDEPVITITYTGEELARSDLGRLFSRAGDQPPGSGLGRVQRLADQHECRLWLESEGGPETSLFLSLPWWSRVGDGDAAAAGLRR